LVIARVSLDTLDDELEAVAAVGAYGSSREVMAHALEVLLIANPSLRVEMAINLWQQEKISLGRAIEIAQIGRERFRQELAARGLHVEVATSEEELRDSEAILDRLRRSHDPR
jgi:predicted HTH domain antitoxin